MNVPSVASIQRAVAELRGVPVAAMTCCDQCGMRKREFAWPRQEAIYLASLIGGRNDGAIGRLFGQRDRTTVIHARRAVRRRIRDDDALRTDLRRVTLALVRPQGVVA